MAHLRNEIHDTRIAKQGSLHSASCIFTKHEILSIAKGKGLLVFTLHNRLNGSLQSIFDEIH